MGVDDYEKGGHVLAKFKLGTAMVKQYRYTVIPDYKLVPQYFGGGK